MDAIISGRAGVAFLVDGEVLSSFDVEDPATLLPRRPADLRLIFGEAPDLQFLEGVSHSEAARHLERAFNCASALDLALILLDAELTDDIRDDAAAELNRLMSDPPVVEYLENVLYSRPLPASADLVGALTRCEGGRLPRLSETLQIIEGYQSPIRAVRAAWDDLPKDLFGGADQKAEFEHVAVRAGLFRLLAIEAARGLHARVNDFVIRWAVPGALAPLRNPLRVLQQWSAPFRPPAPAPRVRHEDEDSSADSSQSRRKGHKGPKRGTAEQELNKLQGQLNLIVSAMRDRDLAFARKITNQVIDYQLKTTKPIRAAKTLCNLASEARDLGIYLFQLELTERAIQIADDDGWSWAQYADALLKSQRPAEALQAYEQAEAFGAGPVARRGRADVLIALRRFDDALAAYDSVLAEDSGDVIAKSGRAETLRALGRLPEALAAYDSAVADHSENVIAKTGRAETLRALGRLHEALAAYDSTVAAYPENVVAETGRAETLRALNRLPEALAAYDSIVADHPEDIIAKNGRAETLRVLGRLPEALTAYDSIVADHPESVVAKSGRAEVLKALGRLDTALSAYNEVFVADPNNIVIRNGLSAVLVALRRYDEALQYLPDVNPVTLGDWIGYHIRGMILLRTGKVDEAVRIFERGVRENPIPSSKEYFSNALAVARLRVGDYEGAGSALDGVTAPHLQPQANVLRLHRYGASGDVERAAAAYNELRDKPWFIPDELVAELHRKYILKEAPRHDDDWVFEHYYDTFDPSQHVIPFAQMVA